MSFILKNDGLAIGPFMGYKISAVLVHPTSKTVDTHR